MRDIIEYLVWPRFGREFEVDDGFIPENGWGWLETPNLTCGRGACKWNFGVLYNQAELTLDKALHCMQRHISHQD